MIHWRRLMPWLFRAWPVLALAPVGAIHAIALRAFPSDPVAIYKLVGMGLQVIGGLLVLYSINDNLGLFRSQSLSSTIIGWLKSFPYVRKPISLSSSASASASLSATISATVDRASNTLEERAAEIERKLVDVQRQLTHEVQAINARIEDTKSELGKQIAETSTRVSDLSKRLEHAAVGGFKFQALVVLLALHGAVTSLFA